MLSASPLFAVLLSGIALMPVASAFVPAALVGGVRAHASLAPQPGSGRSSLFRLHQPHRTLGLRMAAGEGLGGGESGLEGAGGGGTPEGASADQMSSQASASRDSVLLRRLDMEWVEQQLNKEVTRLHRQTRRIEADPRMMRAEIERCVAESDFEQAAHLRDTLKTLVEQEDVNQMKRVLAREIQRHREHIRKMLSDEVKTIQYRMQLAIAADNFESAARLLTRLKAAEAKRMFAHLKAQVQCMRRGYTDAL